jgi:hypothetical protein
MSFLKYISYKIEKFDLVFINTNRKPIKGKLIQKILKEGGKMDSAY